jgi:hypothetical protein
MKIIVRSTLLVMVCSVAVMSQNNQNQELVRQRLEEIKTRLKLTPAQVEQVRPILVDEVQQLRAVQEKYAKDQSAGYRLRMLRDLREVLNKTDEKYAKVLSKQQLEELKKIRQEWIEERRERGNQK